MKLPLDSLRLDPALQFRAGLDPAHVEALGVAYAEGAAVPPLVACSNGADGGYLLLDGAHRLAALRQLGVEQADVELADGPPDRGAAFANNLRHGLPPSAEERREHARWLQCRDPSLSERDLSKLVGLSASSVHRALAERREQAPAAAPDFARSLVRLATRAVADWWGGRPDDRGTQGERVSLLAAELGRTGSAESIDACLFIGAALHAGGKLAREQRELAGE